MHTLLVTGSSGLIGSEVVAYFCQLGWQVHGIDNNMRADFFGPEGDTRGTTRRLRATHATFRHHHLDIRDRAGVAHAIELRVPYLDHTLVEYVRPLAAAQKLARGVNKPLLVQAVGEPALRAVGQAKKQGFTFPLGEWMRQHADTFEEIALRADVLDRHTVQQLWSAFRAGRLHWSRAWALVVLGSQGWPSSPEAKSRVWPENSDGAQTSIQAARR